MFFASITLANRPLRKHMLSSAASKGHISRLQLADFDPMLFISFRGNYIWQLTFSNVLLFSFIRLVNLVDNRGGVSVICII